MTSGGFHCPTAAERQAVALERIAAAIEKFGKSDGLVGGVPIFSVPVEFASRVSSEYGVQVHDAAAFAKPSDATVALSNKLIRWLFPGPTERSADILVDAVRQATDPKTIEWLAAIAERYGFKQ